MQTAILGPDGRPIRPQIVGDTSRDPVVVREGYVPGKGPRVKYQFRNNTSATYSEEEASKLAADLTMTKWVAEVLHTSYRGHFWSVEVSSRQGICRIGIPALLGNWTYNIPLPLLTHAMVLKGGGEILERFNIPRSSIDVAAFVKAREKRVERASQRPPTG